MTWRLLLSTVLLAVAVSPAAAQVATFEDLPDRLNLGDRVTVVDAGGTSWRGRVVDLTSDRIVLDASPGDIALAAPDVRQVSTCCDSLKNGAINGAVVGGVIGFLGGYGFVDGNAGEKAGAGALLAVIFGAIDAGVGIGIDALIRGDRVVYRAEGPTISMAVDPFSRAVGVRIAWGGR